MKVNLVNLALPIRAIYLTYQMRKAQYMKFNGGKDNHLYMRQYYEDNIRMDRRYISLFVHHMTGKDITKIHGSNFDSQIIPIMQKNTGFKEVNVKISGDMSYNIVFVPEFKDVTYYEFILPYVNYHK
jgi:hypothetical protein